MAGKRETESPQGFIPGAPAVDDGPRREVSKRVYVDLSRQSLYDEIVRRVKYPGTTDATVPYKFYIEGSQTPEDTIPLYPGMDIEGVSTAPGASVLKRPRGKVLAEFPGFLRRGGGGSGKPYMHHTKLTNVRLEGIEGDADDMHEILGLYIGGFQCVFDKCLLTRNEGPGFTITPHVMNLVFRDCDASRLGGLGVFDLSGSTIAGFHWVRGQIDDVGPVPFRAFTRRTGGLGGSLCHYVFDGIKWEHHEQEPATAFLHTTCEQAFNNVNFVLKECRANLNHAADNFAFVRENMANRKHRPNMYSLQNVRAYAINGGAQAMLGSTHYEPYISGKRYSDGAFGCDAPVIIGPKSWIRY